MKERPDLHTDLVQIWKDYWKLARFRPTGMGVEPIPLATILAYLEVHGITDQKILLHYVDRLSLIDKLYREAIHKKQSERARTTNG